MFHSNDLLTLNRNRTYTFPIDNNYFSSEKVKGDTNLFVW